MRITDFKIMKVENKSEVKEIAEFVFRTYQKAFEKYGWVGNFEKDILEDDLAFLEHSSIWVARDIESNIIIGTMRLIHRDENVVLPIERDFGIQITKIAEQFNLESNIRVAEVARLAVDAGQTVSQIAPNIISFSLIREGCLESEERGIDLWVASIDVEVWRWLQRRIFNFRQIGKIKFYIGSPTVPVALSVSLGKQELAAKDLALYEFIYL